MYLLDTHTLIWFLADSPELSTKARETICSNKIIFALNLDIAPMRTYEKELSLSWVVRLLSMKLRIY